MFNKMKKNFYALIMLLLFSFFSFNKTQQINLNYYNSFDLNFMLMNFSFLSDLMMIQFFLMVSLVTIFVLSFSKIYMSFYNNKKFIFLLMLFFFSMIILVTSSSLLTLMIGWDGLGVSSICLIMFYPNKNSFSNSILTMFFNRLGDTFMILSLGFLSTKISESFPLFFFSLPIALIMIICAFSKSAQFPLSSWLPAAMSAPTPISAMVHSSTLVTAGIFLLTKMEYFLMTNKIFFIPLVISFLTFLMGGMLANKEKDMKKIVAFSTMSQISMMISFCFTVSVWACLLHMTFHAFFKTMLFSCCGMIFISMLSNQSKKSLVSNNFKKENFFMLFLSIFMMTGLIFSSSFFSKDDFLENFLSKKEDFSFLILIMGSSFTIFYSCYLCSNMKKFSNFYSSNFNSKKSNLSFFLFSLVMVLSPFLSKNISSLMEFSVLTKMEVITIFVFLSTLIFIKIPKLKSLKYITPSIFLMKDYSYKIWGNVLKSNSIKSSSMTELMVFKPMMFEVKKINFLVSKSSMLIFLMLFGLMVTVL